MVIQPGRRVLTLDPFVRISRRAVEVPAGGNWWEAGSAPTPRAVYQPKDAASQAASYTNLVNPGTYDAAPGTAPSWSAAGWAFNGSTQYLTTGIVPASGYSVIIAFANWSGAGWIIGAYNGSGNNRFSIGNPNGPTRVEYGSGKTVEVVYGGDVTAGVLGIAGQQGYRDGSATGGTIAAWDGTVTEGIEIGRLAGLGGGNTASTVIAVAIWNTATDAATWMPEVMAAVAAL